MRCRRTLICHSSRQRCYGPRSLGSACFQAPYHRPRLIVTSCSLVGYICLHTDVLIRHLLRSRSSECRASGSRRVELPSNIYACSTMQVYSTREVRDGDAERNNRSGREAASANVYGVPSSMRFRIASQDQGRGNWKRRVM